MMLSFKCHSFKMSFLLWEGTAQFHQPCCIREDTDFHIVRRNDEAHNQLIKEFGHWPNQSIFFLLFSIICSGNMLRFAKTTFQFGRKDFGPVC